MKRTALFTSILALGLATALSACSKPEEPAEDVVVVEPAMTEEPAMEADTTTMEADTATMEADTAAMEADATTMEADMIANDGEMPVEATDETAPAEMN